MAVIFTKKDSHEMKPGHHFHKYIFNCSAYYDAITVQTAKTLNENPFRKLSNIRLCLKTGGEGLHINKQYITMIEKCGLQHK